MSAPQVSVQENGKAVQYWLNRDQSLSLWDDPSLQGDQFFQINSNHSQIYVVFMTGLIQVL